MWWDLKVKLAKVQAFFLREEVLTYKSTRTRFIIRYHKDNVEARSAAQALVVWMHEDEKRKGVSG